MIKNHATRALLGLGLATGMAGCAAGDLTDGGDISIAENVSSTTQAITDVPHTPVERQSIGNCWLYAQATWVESMALAADPSTELDVSQSYWTYWHWFDQVTGFFPPDELQTGGFQHTAHSIVRDRGLMLEGAFVPDDSLQERSDRQKAALDKINAALENGDFNGASSEEVRAIFDDAWELSPEVRAQLDAAFGADGEETLRQGASLAGTEILDPSTLQVRYTERRGGDTIVHDGVLVDAIGDWEEVRYPSSNSGRRDFLRRVQRALHDRQPVVITWDVDFNALVDGAFTMANLEAAGVPGRQGGHMTVLEDYEAETVEFGLLEAGVTLDPEDPDDAQKLEAALLDSTEIKSLRIKNSWGSAQVPAPGFEGYNDLGMAYLNGPIDYCPNSEDKENDCNGESNPLRKVMLPPGY